MFDCNPLFEFSRAHCITICAFLVPANLLATLRTMLLVGLRRPQAQMQQAAGIAIIFALVMVLHVSTWFTIGVVASATYVLLSLGSVCLGINLWALIHSSSMNRSLGLLKTLYVENVADRLAFGFERRLDHHNPSH